jgi:uncharacterized phiE125 gp8 family phage protein
MIYGYKQAPKVASPYGYKIISQDVDYVLSIEDCRQHLEAQRYQESDTDTLDDAMILAMMKAAQGYCENFTGLAMSRRVVEMAFDDFPTGDIELLFPPLIEFQSLTIAGVAVDSGDYVVDDYQKPARICPVSSWPSYTTARNTIKARYLCGYGSDTDSPELPYEIRAAILLTLGDLYKNRENSADKTMTEIPIGAQALLRPHRVRLGMA